MYVLKPVYRAMQVFLQNTLFLNFQILAVKLWKGVMQSLYARLYAQVRTDLSQYNGLFHTVLFMLLHVCRFVIAICKFK